MSNVSSGPGDSARMPQYIELLNAKDHAQYMHIRMAFCSGNVKRTRGHRLETFDRMLESIRRFAEQGDSDDWRRFLVCGVCWLENAIAINTRQLRLLVDKCKSSINGSLQRLGYVTSSSHTESWKLLFNRIPLLKDNFLELRQWTIRTKLPNNIGRIQFNTPITISVQTVNEETHETQRQNYPLKFRNQIQIHKPV